jgi:hypothetical protein
VDQAVGAPEVTVDILFVCAEELVSYLVTVIQQLDSLRVQVHRDKILLRKQVEEELHAEHQHHIESLRVQMLKVFPFLFVAYHRVMQQERETELAGYKYNTKVEWDIEIGRERKVRIA